MQSNENSTVVTEFILLGFAEFPSFHTLLFALILPVYIITLLANIQIILVIKTDPVLNTPMYFFLMQLAFLEICYMSVTIPKLLQNLLAESKVVSVAACGLQMFLFLVFGIAECFLLAVMAYDRYVAICHPLRYLVIMSKSMSTKLVAGTYICGIVVGLINTTITFKSPFCRIVINHFFCDVQPMLELNCGDTFPNEIRIIGITMVTSMLPFLLILLSYIGILSSVFAMPSSESRYKAFSTCSSHLVVVTLFYGTVSCTYLRPKSSYYPPVDKLLSLSYTVVVPLLNPLIYSVRNQEIKGGFKKLWKKTLPMTK